MALQKLDDGLWTAEQVIPLPGVKFPARSTLVQLRDGGWLVFSPIPRLMEDAPELRRMGPVHAFVAPNLLHHLGLPAAQREFPDARVFARPGLRQKRPDVRFTDELGEVAPSLWSGEVEQLFVLGMPRVEEVVFFHRATRTLLLFDLCFHVRQSPHWPTRLFMRLNDAYGRFGPSRLGRSMMQDRQAVRGAVDRMLAWDPERIVVSHGEVVSTGGRAALEEAFRFLPRSG